MAELNPVVEKTIETIRKRSQKTRSNYLKRVALMEADPDSNHGMIGCSNLAHVAARATIVIFIRSLPRLSKLLNTPCDLNFSSLGFAGLSTLMFIHGMGNVIAI